MRLTCRGNERNPIDEWMVSRLEGPSIPESESFAATIQGPISRSPLAPGFPSIVDTAAEGYRPTVSCLLLSGNRIGP